MARKFSVLCGVMLMLVGGLWAETRLDQDVDLVERVKDALRAEGYDPGPADGWVGEQTRLALRSFQKENNLEATGRIDDATLERLNLSEEQTVGLHAEPASLDDRIRQQIELRLEQEPRIQAARLQVRVEQGVITLTYRGADPTEFTRAVALARTVPGGKKIVLRYQR